VHPPVWRSKAARALFQLLLAGLVLGALLYRALGERAEESLFATLAPAPARFDPTS
jgi:hypothetical protein